MHHRRYTIEAPGGPWIDLGGPWIGPTQDRVLRLVEELGVRGDVHLSSQLLYIGA